ncbi:MAG: ATP-binding cassette domain-containing protein, partial [Leptospirales bacterium]|nr:ATP-binding cassette domain-containing protein [Leptospirales bacterium]
NKLEKIKTLDFSFASKPFQAKSLMNVKELTFGYEPSRPLVNNLSFSINKNDRICVIGKNGRGKSTLLRLLCGDLPPQNGEVLLHPSASLGYYVQTNSISLNPHSTVESEIMLAGCEKQQARDICGAMMFEGDEALKTIDVLSGGEKARVLLGKILVSPSNLLFLDEPTNHLDMESCDSFLSAVDAFDGAVVMVTHNEMFLHSLANRFIVFQNSGPVLFEGSYRRFLDKIGWEEETGTEPVKKSAAAEQLNKKDTRKKRADIIDRRLRELVPIEKNIAALEKQIEELEKQQKLLNDGIIAASSAGESQKIGQLSIELHKARNETDSLYTELLLLTELFEQRNEEFERELNSLSN